jgi:ribosome modulation factor
VGERVVSGHAAYLLEVTRAAEEGAEAYRRGEDASACPYGPDDARRRYWVRGFRRAEDEAPE